MIDHLRPALRAVFACAITLFVSHGTMAQDVSTEYATAFDLFMIPGSDGRDPDLAVAAIGALLPRLESEWVRADILSGNQPSLVPDISAACRQVSEQLVQTGPHGFEMRRLNRDGEVTLHFRYEYVGLSNFVRTVDENEWLAYLGFAEDDAPVPAHIYFGTTRGEVTLFVPSPNIMVMLPLRGQIEIYARCRQAARP